MVSKLDETLRFQQTALSLRGMRQELLASNIANADTPNYKAKDIDFASALKNALGGSNPLKGTAPTLPMALSSPMHLQGKLVSPEAPVLYRKPVQPSADGNTVDMDVERAIFADNALRYESSVKFVSDQVKEILSAIQGS